MRKILEKLTGYSKNLAVMFLLATLVFTTHKISYTARQNFYAPELPRPCRHESGHRIGDWYCEKYGRQK